jgi:hypothetical protein
MNVKFLQNLAKLAALPSDLTSQKLLADVRGNPDYEETRMLLQDGAVLTGIEKLALRMIRDAIETIQEEKTLEGLFDGITLENGVTHLEENPALLNYTQMVLLIANAIKEEE